MQESVKQARVKQGEARHCDGASLTRRSRSLTGETCSAVSGVRTLKRGCEGKIMGLPCGESLEGSSFPRMTHRGDKAFHWGRLQIISIKILGLIHMLRYDF